MFKPKYIDSDTRNGMILFFGYYIFKLLLFVSNIFIILSNGHINNVLLIISIIFNILFYIIVNSYRNLIFIIGATIGIILYKDNILYCISACLAIINGICYILDLISFIINSLLISILSRFK